MHIASFRGRCLLHFHFRFESESAGGTDRENWRYAWEVGRQTAKFRINNCDISQGNRPRIRNCDLIAKGRIFETFHTNGKVAEHIANLRSLSISTYEACHFLCHSDMWCAQNAE